MADTKISNLTLNLTPSATDTFPIVNNNLTKKVSLSDAFNSSTVYSTTNYIIVKVSDNALTNGTNLLNAYTNATTLTPNTSALSSSNRAVIILPSATYNLSVSSLNLNTQYIDIVGWTRDASYVTITSTNSSGAIIQTANDVRCVGLTINNNGTGYGWKPDSNLSLAYWENVIFSSINSDIISGTFINCKSSNNIAYAGAFGGDAYKIVSGTFVNCIGNNSGYGGGGFGGFGADISGKFTNCTGTNTNQYGGGFGGWNAKAFGSFYNCTGTNTNQYGGGFVGPSGPASGVFYNCIGINRGNLSVDGGGFVGQEGIASGIFYNCTGTTSRGPGSGGFAGLLGIASGIFYNCTGITNGGPSGSSGICGLLGVANGLFINFKASCDNIYDVALGGTLTGQFINCSSTDSTLQTLSNSGDTTKPACYINCLDGSGRLVNGSA